VPRDRWWLSYTGHYYCGMVAGSRSAFPVLGELPDSSYSEELLRQLGELAPVTGSATVANAIARALAFPPDPQLAKLTRTRRAREMGGSVERRLSLEYSLENHNPGAPTRRGNADSDALAVPGKVLDSTSGRPVWGASVYSPVDIARASSHRFHRSVEGRRDTWM